MPASLILAAIYETTALAITALGTVGYAAATFAINFVVSAIVARSFAQDQNANASVDNGVRQQVPPATTNSIPIVYGDAYMGGTFVDAVLSVDQKCMYYVLAVSSISPNGQFTFYPIEVINAGDFVINTRYKIESVGTTNFTLIGASSNTVGTWFVATGSNKPCTNSIR